MFTILYSRPKRFPAGPVRTLLSQHVPLYSWTGGEEDDGSADCAYEYERPILVSGRANNDAVFVEVDVQQGAIEDVPPPPGDAWFAVRAKRPTTESEPLAERIAAVMASSMARIDTEGVVVRFDGTDKWIGLEDVVRLCDLVIGGEKITDMVAGIGDPSQQAPRFDAPDPGLQLGRAQNQTIERGNMSPSRQPDSEPAPTRPAFGRRTGGFGKRGL